MTHQGRLQASLLAGVWRTSQDPPPLTPAELADITPALLEAGAGGLAWRRVRCSNLASTPSGAALQDAYRLHSLRSALKEDDTRKAITVLRSAGVEPLLLKGWAMARWYSERGLRPYGDIDLLVRSEDLNSATRTLAGSPRLNTTVELHPGLLPPVDRPTSELFARSQLAWLDSFPARVLGLEDQLRYMCLHLFKHGARRPLLLVDIALLLENIPRQFDWDYCTGGSKRQTDWTTAVLKLAHDILGASLDAAPTTIAGRRLPAWVVKDVLKQWGRGMRHYSAEFAEHYLRNPREIPDMVIDRWPNGVDTTVWAGLPIDGLPRLPLQLVQFLHGAAVYPPHLVHRLLRSVLRGGRYADRGASGVKTTRNHTVLQANRPWDST